MPQADREEPAPVPRPGYFIQSLERGLAIIKAFDESRPQMTVSEVAKATGLDRASARRFLLTLADLGYIVTDGRLYALRPRVLELGYAFLSSLSLPELALPHMEELVAKVHETSSLGVLDDGEVVFVARVPTKRLMSVPIMVGSRFPAYATSMGRVLLAGLSRPDLDKYLRTTELKPLTDRTVTDPDALRSVVAEARERGWATVDQEMDDNSRSVAVAIRDRAGRIVAALNVSTVAGRGGDAALREFLPHIERAAGKIEADLQPGGLVYGLGRLG
ncbi:MAG TPA: IclR family transcriptional regulator C-terminal domain-containing protein [Trebonia sp.]|nr:IclR family transcriptional regulator C-terminal domain-containing protein [Trebonia sp.]